MRILGFASTLPAFLDHSGQVRRRPNLEWAELHAGMFGRRVVAICAAGIRKQGDVEDVYRQLEAVAKTGRLAEQLAVVLKNILPEK